MNELAAVEYMTEFNRPILDELDEGAKKLAVRPVEGTVFTDAILRTTAQLYRLAQSETRFKDAFFESAYHSPITGDLEFFLARVLYWYSSEKSLRWKILLRRQVKRVVPDIRIEIDGSTTAIIEVKAKVGFQQCCYSKERFEYDLERFNSGKSKSNPAEQIERVRGQFQKYQQTFNLPFERVYLFLPTLAMVHREKYSTTLNQYYKYISTTTGLPQKNLIILSKALRLNLAKKLPNELMPTGNFERMLLKLSKLK
jgi:hypothetical protein